MKRLLLAVIIFALCLIAPTFIHATSIGFSSSTVVGTVTPGAPANPANVAAYINSMIGLSLGGSETVVLPPPHTQTITRSNNPFGSLPTAVSTGAITGTGTTVTLGATGFTYLSAKYDAGNDETVVWNVSGLTGSVTIPGTGPMGHGLSGWTLFNSGTPVPDDPSSLMLLGISALGFLAPIRRKLMPRNN